MARIRRLWRVRLLVARLHLRKRWQAWRRRRVHTGNAAQAWRCRGRNCLRSGGIQLRASVCMCYIQMGWRSGRSQPSQAAGAHRCWRRRCGGELCDDARILWLPATMPIRRCHMIPQHRWARIAFCGTGIMDCNHRRHPYIIGHVLGILKRLTLGWRRIGLPNCLRGEKRRPLPCHGCCNLDERYLPHSEVHRRVGDVHRSGQSA